MARWFVFRFVSTGSTSAKSINTTRPRPTWLREDISHGKMSLYEFSREQEREHALRTMRAYVENKPEQVKFFEELIGPYLSGERVSVLDACCGIGDLIYFLAQLNPKASF